MFQNIDKRHTMITRKEKRFKEMNARTVRMSKSAIPNMQKHLNKKHE